MLVVCPFWVKPMATTCGLAYQSLHLALNQISLPPLAFPIPLALVSLTALTPLGHIGFLRLCNTLTLSITTQPLCLEGHKPWFSEALIFTAEPPPPPTLGWVVWGLYPGVSFPTIISGSWRGTLASSHPWAYTGMAWERSGSGLIPSCGPGKKTSGIATGNHETFLIIYYQFSSQFIQDLQGVTQTILILQGQRDWLAAMVLQHQQGFLLLRAERWPLSLVQGGMCFWVNQLVIVKDQMWQLQTDLQKH